VNLLDFFVSRSLLRAVLPPSKLNLLLPGMTFLFSGSASTEPLYVLLSIQIVQLLVSLIIVLCILCSFKSPVFEFIFRPAEPFWTPLRICCAQVLLSNDASPELLLQCLRIATFFILLLHTESFELHKCYDRIANRRSLSIEMFFQKLIRMLYWCFQRNGCSLMYFASPFHSSRILKNSFRIQVRNVNVASELMIHLSALLSETKSAAIERYDVVVKSKVSYCSA
jgi:uncharacterized protein YggT (Ycf19 family)